MLCTGKKANKSKRRRIQRGVFLQELEPGFC
jgi:hypothetical protein